VYQRKNLEMAWETVKANRGSGVDGQSLEGFAAQLDQQLDRLQSELKEDVYRPQPVRQVQIPKAGGAILRQISQTAGNLTGFVQSKHVPTILVDAEQMASIGR
jgi:retron-type reverse transcriptase